MRSVYVVLTNTNSYLSKAIEKVTSTTYTHASLALDKSLDRIYSFGRTQPINPFWGGFVREDFVRGTFSWFPDSTCAIYKLDMTVENHNKLKSIIRSFEERPKNYFYNYFGLIGVPLNRSTDIPYAYFCSQFVAEVLKRSGVELFSKKSSLVKPNDFYEHPKLELIYEGELYQYPNLYSRGYYQPKGYRSFPFRKYLKEQFYYEVFKSLKPGPRQYYFGDGFIKPKKIYLGSKLKQLKVSKKISK